MRRRWIIFAIPVLLAALLAGLALSSERFLVASLHWAAGHFADLTLNLREPRINLLSGELSAAEIHFVPRGTDGPALLSVLDFSASTRVGDLVRGDLIHSTVRARQLIIYVSENDDTEDPSPMEWLHYLGWLPHKLELEQAHLISASTGTFVFPLKGVRSERVDPTRYVATADALYDGEPLELSLELDAITTASRFTSLKMKGEFRAPESGSQIRIDGELSGTAKTFQYDFTMDGNYQDVEALLAGFESPLALEGSLKVSARMQGNGQGFVLSDATLILDNRPAYAFEAGGRLDYQLSGESRLDLVAAGDMASLDYLTEWWDLDLRDLGRAQASLRLTGSLGHPLIDQFILRTQHEGGLVINISGTGYVPGMGPEVGTELVNEIRFDAYGPSLSVLEPWLGSLPVDTGAWRSSGRLLGNREHTAAEDLIIETGNQETVELRAEGRIGNIVGAFTDGLPGLDNVQLKATAYTPDTKYLSALLHKDLPQDHKFEAVVPLAGSGDRLEAKDANLEVTAPGLKATLDITHAVILPGEDEPVRDVSGELVISVEDTSVLSAYTEGDTAIPALGAIRLSGQLQQHDSVFRLQGIQGGIKTDAGLEISTRGQIAELNTLSGLSLATQFSGLSIGETLSHLIEDFDYPAPLGLVQGRFTLIKRLENWDIKKLELNMPDIDGPMVLSATGDLNDVTHFPTANLVSDYQIRDPELVRALLGVPLSPLAGRLSFKTAPGKLTFSNHTRIGRNALDLAGIIMHGEDSINSLRAVLSTPHLYLQDLGMQLSVPEDKEQNSERAESGDRLEKLLETPPPYPTDVSVNIDQITGSDTEIQGMHVHITGENRRYTLRRFSMDYAHATAEVRGIIDLNPRPPALSLAGEAIAVPLLSVSRDLGVESDVTGTVTARGGITASGISSEALVSTLQGNVAFALEDATIKGAAYDILATDLLEWIYSGAAMETSTTLDCIMARFDLERGLARSDSLYIETPKMVATGKAMFDLVGKKMDVTVTPMSKSRAFQVPSSVRIKGDMSNPTPIVSPVTAVMDAYTQAVTLVPRLTLKLFGVEKKTKKQRRPCEAT